MNSNYKIAMGFRNTEITIEDIKTLEDKISPECRYYLIGLLFRYELSKKTLEETIISLTTRIGRNFNYVSQTVVHSGHYVDAIGRLENLVPELIPLIFERKTRLSIENTMILSKKEINEIHIILEKLTDENKKIYEVFPEQLQKSPSRKKSKTTVKDTPTYDPDAQISSLTYTVPSWLSVIDKAFMNTDFGNISSKARYKFIKELTLLRETVDIFLEMIREELQANG
ncbi:MAG: hypothetical protein FWF94_04755 [Oscillospiraceae bacterium]|nr:hypothetical protein [Oscillospiraceae bacterium]